MIPAKLALVGIPYHADQDSMQPPITAWWRKALIHFMLMWVRIILFIAGFYWVKVEGQADPNTRIYVSSHHSIWDTLYLMYYTGCCEAAKSDIFDVPVLGTYMRVLSALPIDRRTDVGRETARYNIKERALDRRYPPLVVFPTGTCNNIREMTEFKTGAFDTGFPYPTREQQADPAVYAENVRVRQLMCSQLGRLPVPFVFEDEMLRTACVNKKMPLCQTRLMMQDVFREFGTSDRILEFWVDKLHTMDVDGDGLISVNDIKDKFTLDPQGTKCAEDLLNLLKQNDPVNDKGVPTQEGQQWGELSWYAKIAGGSPPLPKRPKDKYSPNALGVHEIIPMLLVLYNASRLDESYRQPLELLYSAFNFTLPVAVLDEHELASTIRQELSKYIPDLFTPPIPRRNTVSTVASPSASVADGSSLDGDSSSISPKGPEVVYEKFKVFLFTVTLIAPIRIFIIVFLLIIGVCMAKVASIGLPPIDDAMELQPPIDSKWRRFIVFLMRIGMRWIMFLAGFYWVNIEGYYDPRARIIISTHHSIWDTIYLMIYTGCCEAAKADLFKVPMLGSFLRSLNAMPIDRRCPEARRAAKRNMRARALDPRYPPMIVFPTATCNNSRQLSAFKEGAFDCGVPIQPVGLEYPARHNDIFALKNMAWVFYWSCCQFVNFHTVRFLPVYTPSEAEIASPSLYAQNVRSLMCTKLQREAVPYVFEDELLRIVCRDNFMRVHQHRIMMKQVYEEFGISMHYVDHWVKLLHRLDLDGDGLLSISDVQKSLVLSSDSDEMKMLKRIWAVLKVDESADPKYEDIPAPMNKALTKDGSWYDYFSGGNPPVPSRPLDEIPGDLLAIHDIVPAFVVVFSRREDAVEKRRDGLECLFRAAFEMSPEDFTTEELQDQLRQKLTKYLPTIGTPPQRHGYRSSDASSGRNTS
ncbi:Lysophosphatidylcholine acyltransferase 2 [Perkinsus chesapeaki]|uniref:Lysophosphatidylcholine acyltransferase 2 n=1 Tax=Perkinsus chesapeaki TaxID=330153 RepID=A0A7J6LB21_PERCH|nr:Lysophosphatidylcholine acyltransferase 2 [Perkinsus chesapeaki]